MLHIKVETNKSLITKITLLPAENFSWDAPLNDYMKGKEKLPPLDWTKTTPFQQRVYEVLLRLPRNKTITYGELAKLCGTSPRGVGTAMRLNPFPYVIPCHLVVGQKGLVGFGYGLEMKRQMLEAEGIET